MNRFFDRTVLSIFYSFTASLSPTFAELTGNGINVQFHFTLFFFETLSVDKY